MFTEENIGREMSGPGSTRPAGRREDFKPEEPRLSPRHPGPSINLDHPSGA